jgi:ABC-type multidrug transport system fused ATPase/permease subunit
VHTANSRSLNTRLGLGIGMFSGAAHLFANGVVLSVLYFGGTLMRTSSDISAGNLMTFLVSAQTMQRSLSAMSLVFGTALRGTEAGARVMEYLKSVPAVPVSGGSQPADLNGSCSVTFDKVSFAYPSRPDQTIL